MAAIVCRSPDRATTVALGHALGRALLPLPPGGAVVALHGDLGAGKTTFTGGLALGLGVPPASPVVSPTFTFARAYRGHADLWHVDAYRISSRADLEASGFEELGGDGRVTVVEWGERIAADLPRDRLEVTLLVEPDDPSSSPSDPPPAGDVVVAPTGRRLTVVATGPASAVVLARFAAAPEARGAGARTVAP